MVTQNNPEFHHNISITGGEITNTNKGDATQQLTRAAFVICSFCTYEVTVLPLCLNSIRQCDRKDALTKTSEITYNY